MHKYTLEKDVKHLRSEKCVVIAQTQTMKGHIILWMDNKGYTVTERKYNPESSSIGAALPLERAVLEYEAAFRHLV